MQRSSPYNVEVTSHPGFGQGNTITKVSDATTLKQKLKKYLPFFYHSLVARKLLKYQKGQYKVYCNVSYDLLIEFYTVGSTLGANLKERTKAKYLLIYDCPVLEQFREMHGTSTLFDTKFRNAEKFSIQR